MNIMNNFAVLLHLLTSIAGVSCNAYWANWGLWSECSKSCETGIQYRTRTCTERSFDCKGNWWQLRDCFIPCTTETPLTSLPGSGCFSIFNRGSYRGTISHTKSGYTCQNWSSQVPFSHKFTPENYPDAGLEGNNFCRNPDFDSSPWCFTTNMEKQWEYCDIPICTDSTTTTTTTTSSPVVSSVSPVTNTECGNPELPLFIVGGIEANQGSIPWQVSLRRGYAGSHFCGASLIKESWVITAAHCVIEPENPSSYYGIAGDHLQYQQEPNEKRIEFNRIFRHENYNPSTLANDITLMKTTVPVTYSRFIKPICLPPVNSVPEHGTLAIVSGWGSTKGTGSDAVLRQATLPIVDNRKCNEVLGGVTSSMLCAGLEQGGKDSCQGDSGGPLFKKSEETGSFELIGIVSWGYGCAEPNQPGVYTLVSRYISWINSILGAN